jgi:superfamily II DNA or RNA helicase
MTNSNSNPARTGRQNTRRAVAPAEYKLLPHQIDAYNCLEGQRLGICNMPTGSGKSLTLSALGGDDLQDMERKVIVAVPQCMIGNGFSKPKVIDLGDGSQVKWRVSRNLCEPIPSKVNQLVDFIRRTPRGRQRRVALCTHMSLAYAFQKMTPNEFNDHLSRTTLIIDEAHHIRAGSENANRLGSAITSILEHDDPTSRILLATAYFFRGDQLPILDEDQGSQFTRFHLPFEDYWNSLQYLKSYAYDFMVYKGTPFEELEALLRIRQEPTIVFIPPEGRKTLLGKSKREFTDEVLSLCRKYYKNTEIIDLVDEQGRGEKVQLITEYGDKVGVILTVGMMKEGADWVQASRVIDLQPSGSEQDRLQRFGRLCRDWPGKDHVSYYSFFPCSVKQDDDERRKHLTTLYAHFHASLVLQHAIRPIRIPVESKPGKNGKSGSEKTPLNLLGQLDVLTQQSIVKDAYEGLVRLKEGKSGESVSAAEAEQVVCDVIRRNGVESQVNELAKQVVLVLRRGTDGRIRAERLVDAGFDKVWASDVFDGLLAYSGEVGGPRTLAEIRQVFDNIFEADWIRKYEIVRGFSQSPSSQQQTYWWCTYNKVLFAEGLLPKDKQEMLERIPWWKWTKGFADRWLQRFDEIQQLPKCPKSGTPEYDWVRQQRRQHQKGLLIKERIQLLETISWWKWANITTNWNDMFIRVSEFDAMPKRGTREYDWIRTQRKNFNKGTLAPDRSDKLNTLSLWAS